MINSLYGIWLRLPSCDINTKQRTTNKANYCFSNGYLRDAVCMMYIQLF